MKTYHSNGKLLLTGEYAVLDGALCLALPTVYGQQLSVKEIPETEVQWTSRDHKGNPWFQANIPFSRLHGPRKEKTLGKTTEEVLVQILKEAKELNPDFLSGNSGFAVTTEMDFPREWGLGTSSTLINNMAQWSGTDPYELLQRTFGGSGYDIACARNNHPILYQLEKGWPRVEGITFAPDFVPSLFFVYLNRKQDSREAIARYREHRNERTSLVAAISTLTRKIANCTLLEEFEALLDQHEALISKAIGQLPIKESLFPDYPGTIKSLGAWGGDFILATGTASSPVYFQKKGYDTIIPYPKMVL